MDESKDKDNGAQTVTGRTTASLDGQTVSQCQDGTEKPSDAVTGPGRGNPEDDCPHCIGGTLDREDHHDVWTVDGVERSDCWRCWCCRSCGYLTSATLVGCPQEAHRPDETENMGCPTPCDPDCDARCHDEHLPVHKRDHRPEDHR